MAIEWDATCADCSEPFSYSDSTLRSLHAAGLLLPEVCPSCEIEFRRERRALGRKRTGPGQLPMRADWADLAIGRFAVQPEGTVRARTIAPAVDEERRKFGVKDERLLEFYRKLDDPKVQVILVEAPTGAGKSTFFPYRLLEPPAGIPDPQVFTRNGQIVVTQPRIQATRNIPAYVSKLHGCRVGAGFDVGFRYSAEHACDWRCKLVYLTDGTLVNWIASGMLAKISVIMLDEAHERSLTIDLIIGLLTKMLPRYPWLKLVIASATIDHEKFTSFFRRHLRGATRCERIVFEGKPGMPVRKHFRCGTSYEEDHRGEEIALDAEVPAPALPYRAGNLKELLEVIPVEVGRKCVELLERMHPSEDASGRGATPDLVERRGDVLAFLYGKKSIEAAMAVINEQVARNPVLRSCVKVLPLYGTLPLDEQRRALEPPVPGVTRVILSTNVAETSLTLEGIKHVVETGLINRNFWDTATETAAVRQDLHSQAGCKQRWGRAGRVTDGDAWCLYTREQFMAFPTDTTPAISSSRLEPVVLTAKFAGVDSLDAEDFPWLDAPPSAELARALQRLRQHGALDEDGDITARGVEIQRFGADVRTASLILLSDEYACAVEMATVLPFVDGGGRTRLLLSDGDWDDATKDQVRRVHDALTWGCRDDLELVLKVFVAWEEASSGGPTVTDSWAWRATWDARRRAHPLPKSLTDDPRARDLEQTIAGITKLADFDQIEREWATEVLPLRHWLEELRGAFRTAASESWAKLWFVNDAMLREVRKARDERIDLLAVRKRERERRLLCFESLDKLRALLAWACSDHCFLKSDEVRGGRPVYRRLADHCATKERMAARAGLVESDDGDEDERIGPSILLQIGDRSICQNRTPAALVGFGTRVRREKPHPNAEERELLNVSFVVEIDPTWPEKLLGLDNMAMGFFLNRYCPPQPRDVAALGPTGPTAERMFVDQRYPIFSQFEFEPCERRATGEWEVELKRPVAYWPRSRAIEPTLRVSSEDPVVVVEELEGTELCTDLLTRIHNEDGVPKVDAASLAQPEDVDDSDEDVLADDSSPLEGLEPEAAPSEVRPSEARSDVDDEHEPGLGTAGSGVLDWQPVRALLVTVGDALPSERVAEVATYSDGPTVVLHSPTPEVAFRTFCERHAIGDTVPFDVIAHRRVNTSAAVGLVLREPETGLETELLPDQVSFASSPELALEIGVHERIEATVIGLDERRSRVVVSMLPGLERLQEEIGDRHGAMFLTLARIIGLGHNRVRFVLDPEQLVGRPGKAGQLLTAELLANSGRVAIDCAVGRPCNVRVGFRRAPSVRLREVSSELGELLQALSSVSQQLVWDAAQSRLVFESRGWDPGARRVYRARFDRALLVRAEAFSSDPKFRAAIHALHRNANTLLALPADADLEERYPAGMRLRGRVAVVGQPGSDEQSRSVAGKVVLDCGIWAFVPPDDFAEGVPSVDDIVPVTVLDSDTSSQRVEATLRYGDEASADVRMGQLRGAAGRLGLVNARDVAVMRNLDRGQLRELPSQIRVLCRAMPWIGWAQLAIDAGHTGLVLGTGQAARRDIEAESGVVMSAHDGVVILLAPDASSLDRGIAGIVRRMGRDRRVEVVIREDPTSGFSSGDIYEERRTAPLAQLAGIPTYAVSAAVAARTGVRERLGRLAGWLRGAR